MAVLVKKGEFAGDEPYRIVNESIRLFVEDLAGRKYVILDGIKMSGRKSLDVIADVIQRTFYVPSVDKLALRESLRISIRADVNYMNSLKYLNHHVSGEFLNDLMKHIVAEEHSFVGMTGTDEDVHDEVYERLPEVTMEGFVKRITGTYKVLESLGRADPNWKVTLSAAMHRTGYTPDRSLMANRKRLKSEGGEEIAPGYLEVIENHFSLELCKHFESHIMGMAVPKGDASSRKPASGGWLDPAVTSAIIGPGLYDSTADVAFKREYMGDFTEKDLEVVTFNRDKKPVVEPDRGPTWGTW